MRITDEAAVPGAYCRIDGVIWETTLSLLPVQLAKALDRSVQDARPNADAIKAVVA